MDQQQIGDNQRLKIHNRDLARSATAVTASPAPGTRPIPLSPRLGAPEGDIFSLELFELAAYCIGANPIEGIHQG